MKALLLLSFLLSSVAMAKEAPANVVSKFTAPATAKHSANTPADRLNREWWKKRHEQKLAEVQKNECDLLFIGDSITHSWENLGKKVWKEYYGKRKALNIGFSGDRTEHVLWRFEHGELGKLQPKVAVIMIGTNNTGHSMQKATETADGVKAILRELHKHSPKTQVILLGIFPRGGSPTDKMRVLNNEINALIQKEGNKEWVHYLDISSAFLDKDGNLPKKIMPDLLHPKADGYRLWADAMEPLLKRLLEEK